MAVATDYLLAAGPARIDRIPRRLATVVALQAGGNRGRWGIQSVRRDTEPAGQAPPGSASPA